MQQEFNVQRACAGMPDYPFGTPLGPDSKCFTREEVHQFRTLGYTVLKGFFRDEVEELRAAAGGAFNGYTGPPFQGVYVPVLSDGVRAAADLLQRAVPQGLPDVGRDRWLGEEGRALERALGRAPAVPDTANPDRVTYIDNLQKWQPRLGAHLRSPKLLSALSELLGPDIDAFQCATSVKPNHHDNEDHGWHQDVSLSCRSECRQQKTQAHRAFVLLLLLLTCCVIAAAAATGGGGCGGECAWHADHLLRLAHLWQP